MFYPPEKVPLGMWNLPHVSWSQDQGRFRVKSYALGDFPP